LKLSGRSFSATSRPSLVSRARNTVRIPPAPMGALISYTPNIVPSRVPTFGDRSIPSPKADAEELGVTEDSE
jgi:hypothetical protein